MRLTRFDHIPKNPYMELAIFLAYNLGSRSQVKRRNLPPTTYPGSDRVQSLPANRQYRLLPPRPQGVLRPNPLFAIVPRKHCGIVERLVLDI